MSDLKSRKASLEKDVLITLKSSRDTQLSLVSCDEESVAIINSRHSLNVRSFYIQIAIARENAFLKAKREAEKEAKKKKRDDATLMDVTPDARVIDVLDQRLKQLGLIGKKSRSDSSSRSSSASLSRSRSRSQSTSPASSRGSSTSRISSCSSSRSSRGHSCSILKQRKSPGNQEVSKV